MRLYVGPNSYFNDQWNDLIGSVEDAQGIAALTRESYRDGSNDSGFLMRFFRHDQNDELQITFQLNHSVRNSEARFHLHTIPMVAPSVSPQNTYWSYYWTIASVGGALPRNLASWSSGNLEIPVATGDEFKHQVFSIFNATIPPTASSSAFLFVRIIRSGTNPLDTYNTNKAAGTGAANLAIIGLDVHVQLYRPGTVGEFI